MPGKQCNPLASTCMSYNATSRPKSSSGVHNGLLLLIQELWTELSTGATPPQIEFMNARLKPSQ
eukprot:1159883-Pelagomonas_calceolata.AAC.11